MHNEILIYDEIYSWSAAQFLRELNEVHGEDVTIRIASNGGNPEYVWGMASKLQEHEGNVSIKVDGKAHSTMAYFLALVDDSEALDVASFIIHRAAYSSYLESSESFMTEDRISGLAKMNKDLKNALEAKIDVDKFNALKQVKAKEITFNDIFSLDARHEIDLSAQDAKKIGLINRIVKITPTKKAEVKSLSAHFSRFNENQIEQMAARHNPESHNQPINKPTKKTTMDIAKFKLEHSDVYASVIETGIEQGVKKEYDRVSALMVYIDVDKKAVKKYIEDKSEMTAKLMGEFNLATIKAAAAGTLEDESAEEINTDTPEGGKGDKENLAEFSAASRKHFGLKSETKEEAK